MGTSPETFNQVRDILRKLDRSINDARDRRLADQEPAPPARAEPTPQQDETSDGEPRPLRARPLRRPPGEGDRWASHNDHPQHRPQPTNGQDANRQDG